MKMVEAAGVGLLRLTENKQHTDSKGYQDTQETHDTRFWSTREVHGPGSFGPSTKFWGAATLEACRNQRNTLGRTITTLR